MMLEKPGLDEKQIYTCLADNYCLSSLKIEFLPLGADQNTAVYAVHGQVGPEFFLKLRSGPFDEKSVTLPKYLSDMGLKQIIPPLTTQAGSLWTELAHFKVILYPFIEGRSGYEVPLPDTQWVAFGEAMKRVHTIQVPTEILTGLRQETYPADGREIVQHFLDRVTVDSYRDKVAFELAQVLLDHHELILDLVVRAEKLAGVLQRNPRPYVLCHYDIHAGNLHITETGNFYIVDWDNPMMAPKERDLMYIGGGLLGEWRPPAEEGAGFYQGYGPTSIDHDALAYYRYERIIQDIAVYCEQIFLSEKGGADREQSLGYLKSNFLPGGTLEVAYQTDLSGRFSH
jgi:spectinomycin phosphotransferase